MSLSRALSSLSVQVTAGYVALGLLLAAAGLYTLGAFQRQLGAIELVNQAAQLELTVEQMHAQGMNYWQNAPRDYPTYYRDVRLYYQDLMAQVETIDTAVAAFMSGELSDAMPTVIPVPMSTPLSAWLQPHLGAEAEAAISALERVWESWRAELFAALGEDQDEPRLEWAAEHVIEAHNQLFSAVEAFADALRDWSEREYRLMMHGTIAVALVTLTIAALLLALLHWKVLAPLRRTTAGFQRVADGDFGHRLPVAGTTELQDLTASFNQLSERLDLLYRLIQALQQGQDVDQLMGLLNTEFRSLLGCDWTGLVFIDETRASARVETSWLDGVPQPDDQRLYRLQGTLLERVLADESPLQVTSLAQRARENPAYELLRHLVSLGMQEAIFLPLTAQTQTPIPAVVVFATRAEDGFGDARRRLLGNIAQLLTQGVGRTARLAEQGRLAAIGEFASSIAHELRTPLTTISMAIGYLTEQAQEPRAQRRLDLALGEAERMRRLLEDILLYAKPLSLNPRPVNLSALLAQFVANARERHARHHLLLEASAPDAETMVDPDRLGQILSNLTNNACEAAPEGTAVTWRISEPNARELRLTIHNRGEPIPAQLLPRLTEPFFSTKASGTGLGLAIVRRLVEQHGGRLAIHSDAEQGTRVEIDLPRLVD
jgi:signal transduction histidine kinase